MKLSKDALRDYEPFRSDPERAFRAYHDVADIKKAIIVPDTNVLLAPYRGSSETLEAIAKTYQSLRKEKRLWVPAQVAREFARNRTDLVADVHKYVRDAKSISINGQFSPAPILLATPSCLTANKKYEDAQEAIKDFRKALEELAVVISGWQAHDPVLEVYEPLFDRATIRDVSFDAAALEEIRKSRYERRVPPGFKDKTKDDGGIGDLVIWLTILEMGAEHKADVIFVTEETKVDWFHRSGDQKLFPRYELVEEFRAIAGGKSFGVLTLAQLLASYGASPQVVAEVRDASTMLSPPLLQSTQEAELPSSQLTEDAIALALEQMILEARGRIVMTKVEGGPDFLVRADGRLLGVSGEVLLATGKGVFSVIMSKLNRINIDSRVHGIDESLVVFVTPIMNVRRALAHWFEREGFVGSNVSAALAEVGRHGIRITFNQARDPFLRRAFGVK